MSRKTLKENIELESRVIVIPGQKINQKARRIDENLFIENGEIYAERIGLLNVEDNKVGIVPLKGKYLPKEGDVVLGVIKDIMPMTWVVDINSPYTALLPFSKTTSTRNESEKIITEKMFKVGDLIAAKVEIFKYGINPILTTLGAGLGKKRGGRLVVINPTKIPRVIGRKGSMISLIMKKTNCEVTVGKNGFILVNCNDANKELIVYEALKKIERESHIKGLTDRINTFLEEKMK